ncbi:YceI family protein [Actinoallomurus rhizosphaericola]|uniref:YceI family protein n=1 Tax=Actinoallomurus rhizosphaericola TaxID=2952536 RepID=UPI002090149E|nr:YceI family protein [Actinoallomurus rhizosphaericola]MCO5992079.1 YceI family protein [Actinoallomurus rhizosphaericola]
MSVTATELGLTAGTWNIDPTHSEVTFSIRHLMSKVRGSFTEFSGAIEIAEDVAASTATAEIQLKSIDTRNADRDNHVRSADILDIENHPAMTFQTKSVRVEGDTNLVDGELTIKGISHPVTLEVEFNGVGEDPWGGTRAGFTATGSINRKDYGIEFNVPLPGGQKALLGDKVDITLEIQAVRA